MEPRNRLPGTEESAPQWDLPYDLSHDNSHGVRTSGEVQSARCRAAPPPGLEWLGSKLVEGGKGQGQGRCGQRQRSDTSVNRRSPAATMNCAPGSELPTSATLGANLACLSSRVRCTARCLPRIQLNIRPVSAACLRETRRLFAGIARACMVQQSQLYCCIASNLAQRKCGPASAAYVVLAGAISECTPCSMATMAPRQRSTAGTCSSGSYWSSCRRGFLPWKPTQRRAATLS